MEILSQEPLFIIYIVNFVLGGWWWLIIKLSFVTCHTMQTSLKKLNIRIYFTIVKMIRRGLTKGRGVWDFRLRKVRLLINETRSLDYGKSKSLKSTRNGQLWLPE